MVIGMFETKWWVMNQVSNLGMLEIARLLEVDRSHAQLSNYYVSDLINAYK
jgi:hypothetical protein